MSGLLASLSSIDAFTVLRVLCGLFFIPHIVGKFTEPAALNFFVAAGFKPPAFWMYLAGVIEIVLAIGLIFNIYLFYVAVLTAIHLLVATVGILKVSGGKWPWNIGGAEYPAFWALVSAVIALHALHG